MKRPAPSEIPPHAHYMRPLDGLRGLACLLVVASHIGKIAQTGSDDFVYLLGSSGVIIFFALSGFLMGTLYAEEKFGSDSAGKYMIARMTRIAPPYWVAVLFAWAVYMAIPDFHYQMTPLMMGRSLLFGGNQGVFWSIPPEVQFYVFFLALWFSWQRYRAGNVWWLFGIATVCVAMIATRGEWGGLPLPSKLHIFLFGFIAALALKHEKFNAVVCRPWMQLSLVLLTLGYNLVFITKDTLYVDLVFPALAALMIASLSRSSRLTGPLESDMMRLMGAASFSIYLFHEVLLLMLADLGLFADLPVMATVAIMCVVSIAPPVAFHFLAEKKLNRAAKTWALSAFESAQARFGNRKAAG